MAAPNALALTTFATLLVVLKLVASSRVSYSFSQVNVLVGSSSFEAGLTRLQCALKCYSQVCARFVYNVEGCWLSHDWQLDSNNAPMSNVETNVEYKFKGVCPEDFFYHSTFKKCYFVDPTLISNWGDSMKTCMSHHPAASLVIVKDYNQAIFFQEYLNLKVPAASYEYKAFWTGGRLSLVDYVLTYWWRYQNSKFNFYGSEIWQLYNPEWDGGKLCATVGRDVVGMKNRDCLSEIPFICQVDATI